MMIFGGHEYGTHDQKEVKLTVSPGKGSFLLSLLCFWFLVFKSHLQNIIRTNKTFLFF